MLEEDEELFGEFLAECTDTLGILYDTLDDFEESTDKEEGINILFRGVHTIKGSCIMFGMTKLHDVAHNLETYITPLRTAVENVTTEVINYITHEVDNISTLLHSGDEAEIEESTAPEQDESEDASLEDEIGEAEAQPERSIVEEMASKSNYFSDYIHNFNDLFKSYTKESSVLFELTGNGDLEKILEKAEKFGIETLNSKALDNKKQVHLIHNTTSPLPKESYDLFEKFEEKKIINWILKPARPPKVEEKKLPVEKALQEEQIAEESTDQKASEKKREELIRVPEERINQALDNIWELFLIRNQLSYLIDTNYKWLNKNPEFIRSWELLDSTFEGNITELESRTMRMRMSSLKNIYSRLAKIVRSYTKECGKKIKFATEGNKTELDKKVIDMLYDPLVHLIRNSMDHGIESTNERAAAGKKPEGTIFIDANVIGSEVVITVSDDGKGINPKKVLAHADEKGLDTSWVKTDDEAIKLIFTPGFSTASEVSATSGRGVGMDAVLASVQSIGGDLDVETKVGEGTTFKISLPLSMSVVSALVMNVNNCKIACATSAIVETKKLHYSDLKMNSGELYYLDHQNHIPCVALDKHLYTEHATENPLIKKSETHACMIEIGSRKMALLVDSIEDYSNLVIKPMPKKIPQLPFVTGVSILATGDPIFIFSPPKLIAQFMGHNTSEVNHEHN